MLYDAYVLKLLRFVTSMLCAATFSNSYVKWRLRYMILLFVAVPVRVLCSMLQKVSLLCSMLQQVSLLCSMLQQDSLLGHML